MHFGVTFKRFILLTDFMNFELNIVIRLLILNNNNSIIIYRIINVKPDTP